MEGTLALLLLPTDMLSRSLCFPRLPQIIGHAWLVSHSHTRKREIAGRVYRVSQRSRVPFVLRSLTLGAVYLR